MGTEKIKTSFDNQSGKRSASKERIFTGKNFGDRQGTVLGVTNEADGLGQGVRRPFLLFPPWAGGRDGGHVRGWAGHTLCKYMHTDVQESGQGTPHAGTMCVQA